MVKWNNHGRCTQHKHARSTWVIFWLPRLEAATIITAPNGRRKVGRLRAIAGYRGIKGTSLTRDGKSHWIHPKCCPSIDRLILVWENNTWEVAGYSWDINWTCSFQKQSRAQNLQILEIIKNRSETIIVAVYLKRQFFLEQQEFCILWITQEWWGLLICFKLRGTTKLAIILWGTLWGPW